jgi:Ca2+-binding RTX toxin-like protein
VDLILLNDLDVAEVWVMAADGRGGFDEPVRVWVGSRDEAPENFYGTADINRDGLDDLVATSGESPVRFFGSVTDLLVEDPPDVPPLRCGGRLVTVDLRFGDEPTDGDDVIRGTDGPDVIRAGAGADTVCAGGGDDRVFGGPGNDRLVGGPGADRLIGGPGSDRLRGNRGRDVLRGGAADDRLIGGPGRDRCAGGSGRDVTRSCP